MQGVYQRHPQDREAAVFYALSLLASGSDDDPALTNAKAAVAILDKLFEEQPNHPGIAHYIIHSCDNPVMASLALPAARKYAGIAPASPHAVHMPSHIFARLGLWQDDINSNLAAIKEADKMAAMHLHVLHHKVHSMDFLEYAYLQIGDDAGAKAQIDALAAAHQAVRALQRAQNNIGTGLLRRIDTRAIGELHAAILPLLSDTAELSTSLIAIRSQAERSRISPRKSFRNSRYPA